MCVNSGQRSVAVYHIQNKIWILIHYEKSLPKITLQSNHLVGEHVHETFVSHTNEKHGRMEPIQSATARKD